MCFRKIKLNGEKYNLAQAQAIFDKMSKEIDTLAFENNALKSDLEESEKREATARKLYEEEKTKVTAKNIEIRALKEQLADFPKRGKDGKFVKNND